MNKQCDPDWDKESMDGVEDKALAALKRGVTMFEAPDVLAEIHRQVAKSPAPQKRPVLAWAALGLALVIGGSFLPWFSGKPVGKREMVMLPSGYVSKPPISDKFSTPAKKSPTSVKKHNTRSKPRPAPKPTKYLPRHHIDYIASTGNVGRTEITHSHPEASYLIVCAPDPQADWATPDTTNTAGAVAAPGAASPDAALAPVPMDSYDIRMTDTNTGTVTSLSVTNTLNSDGTEESHIDYSVAEPPTRPGTLPTDRSLNNENFNPDNSGVSMRAAG